MTFVTDFESSLEDLRRILADLERLEKAVRPGGNLHQQLSAISVMRSSTYIVAYNAIERAFRRALVEIRQSLNSEKTPYHKVERYWRFETLEACLADALKQGAKHDTIYERIDCLFAPSGSEPVWNSAHSGLSFGGNIDQTRIFAICKQLGIKLAVPKSAQGGIDLEVIKRKRNNLAHGEESFSEIGNQITVRDLRQTYYRTQLFMKAFLRGLEKYRDSKRYFEAAERKAHKTRVTSRRSAASTARA